MSMKRRLLAYCHSDWKFASDKTKLSEAGQKLTELEKTRKPREGGSIVVEVAPLLAS